jgi:alpha-mannosidase
VISSTAEQMFLDIRPELRARLPRYRGDLELTNHSAGSLTSQAYQKRWNHENEKLADAAEKASVAAAWLGARQYPLSRLNDAWALVMGGQFHDIAAGTATPQAYEYSWNDDVIALNQFASVLTSATEGIASGLDTRGKGIASVVVYNPLNVPREDIVEASLASLKMPKDVRVVGPDGVAVPAQVSDGRVIFLARVPPVGYAVYDVQAARQPAASAVRVSESSLENARYRISLDPNGDIRSIVDKKGDRELLAAPIRLAFQTERPHDWPAWNMDWDDRKQPPRAFVGGPAAVRVVEKGPARVAVEIAREGEGSKFVQTIRLAAGDAGNRIEIANAIGWSTSESALKATFPLRALNPKATYNWEVGTIERGNNDEKQFEVPSHDWIDLTDASGAYGVTILTDSKYGSDKPDDRTLRLTLLYTPGLGSGNGRSYGDQAWQDWGHHEFVYGLAAHGGRQAEDWQALRLANPLIAFAGGRHDGALGKTFSLLRVNDDRVRVLALKKAEDSDETVVRIVNLDDKRHDDVRLTFAAPLTAAREVNGQELPLGKAAIRDGELVTTLTPFAIRSFAVTLKAPATKLRAPHAEPVTLTYDRAITASPGFDDAGRTIPGEMLPPAIDFAGIRFKTTPNALVARGQTIPLPKGSRAYILAAAADGDQRTTFRVGDRPVDLTIEEWTGKIGQWDVRLWAPRTEQLPPRPDAPPNAPARTRTSLGFNGLTPGFIKHAPLAWFASHRRTAAGVSEPYQYSYLFAYAVDVPPGATTLTLPDNDKVRIVAITMSDEGTPLRSAAFPIYPERCEGSGGEAR